MYFNFSLNSLFKALTEEQIFQMMGGIRASCQPRFKVSDADIDAIKNGLFPDDKDLKVNEITFMCEIINFLQIFCHNSISVM